MEEEQLKLRWMDGLMDAIEDDLRLLSVRG
jgi:hypothetical protein